MKKIVIVGASGQIGSLLLDELSKHTDNIVTATSRTGKGGLLKFDPFKDDWNLLGKVDVLINSAGIITEKKDNTFDNVHVGLTKLIIKNRIIIGDPKIIQISALGATTTHPINFLKSKGEADNYLMQFTRTVVIRSSIVCTPNTLLVQKLRLLKKTGWFCKKILLPKGFVERKIQPIMPIDLADVVINVIKNDKYPNIINAVGPESISYKVLIALLMNKEKYQLYEIPEEITRVLVNNIIHPLFPSIITKQQYLLLFSDNIANHCTMQTYIGRKLNSTNFFWENALKQ